MLRICFTDRDLALTRIAPAADMSFELSLGPRLPATRRPESRPGQSRAATNTCSASPACRSRAGRPVRLEPTGSL
ncbi:hypothetical protein ACFC1R_20955 [Kitasatospora sp. NPDC056138]|uniref:hypothetical protein n=1 Tax=Kitasatospora sp. NPDC056138 TaxID=3345724 RepID=UPI0035E36499